MTLPENIKKEIADWVISIVAPLVVIASVLSIIFIFIFTPEQLQRIIPPILMISLITPAWLMVKKGQPTRGIPLILACFILPIIFGMIFNGGVRAPVFVGILPIITIVYCIYGQTRTIIFAIFTLIVGGIFVVLELKQLLPSASQTPAPLILFIYSGWLVFAFIFISIPVKIMKSAQGKLKESEGRYRLLAENVVDVIWTMDMDLNYTYISPSIFQLQGYTVEEMMEKPLDETILPESLEKIFIIYEKKMELLNSGNDQAWEPAVIEAELSCKDGTTIWTDIHARFIQGPDKNATHIIGVTRDITERRRTNEIIIQSEKMMSVGGLAAGMAHEINNPLAGMIQNTDVMLRRMTDTKLPANKKLGKELGLDLDAINTFMEKRDILKMADSIKKSGIRIADLVENMLGFARKSDAQMSSHSIPEALDKTIELAGTDYDLKKHYDFKKIKIRKNYQENLPMIPCEISKLQQVFLNIFNNGAQAMLEAKTDNPVFLISVSFDQNTKMIRIEIQDNGLGMDKKTQKRIFEPFFTTKPVGVGTGLGLSVSYFIITENHKGTLKVESELGKGTIFKIELPLERKI